MGAANTQPFEIIAAPFTVWFAPIGTAFPLIDAVPAATWKKVGSSGDLNYLDEGVTVSHAQSMEFFRALGDSGSRKVFRTEEDLKIRLVLADVSLEQYSHAINSNAVTTTPASTGVAGVKKLGLSRGASVATVALLVRGPSPYGDGWTLQYEVPLAAQSGNPEPVYMKSSPAALALEWTALVDPNAVSVLERFGRLLAQSAAPL
ncbi:MAG TPA: hypothetical protein VK504_33435 [Vicinamibacterales bacterium]|nr:hypothetical protein [Vicinamibacterales bacterium]